MPSSPTPDQLRRLFLFRDWPASALANVAPWARRRRYRKDDHVFLHDDACDHLYCLASGRVRMFRDLPDGRQVTLHEVRAPALVGCAALFLGKAFPASSRVMSSEAEVILIQGEPFLDLLARRPELARRMIGALAARIGELAGRIESQATGSARRRLADWLLDQPSQSASSGTRSVRIEGSKKDLAAALAMTPETLSRNLRSLSDAGLIDVRGRTIEILNAADLIEVDA